VLIWRAEWLQMALACVAARVLAVEVDRFHEAVHQLFVPVSALWHVLAAGHNAVIESLDNVTNELPVLASQGADFA
jgi:hypothetical protein